MARQMYNGPHLLAVRLCIESDCYKNAASWIERDLSEESHLKYGDVDPSTLEIDAQGTVWFDTYDNTQSGCDGAGI